MCISFLIHFCLFSLMQTNTNISIMYYGSEESKLIRERFGLLQLLDGAQHNLHKNQYYWQRGQDGKGVVFTTTMIK